MTFSFESLLTSLTPEVQNALFSVGSIAFTVGMNRIKGRIRDVRIVRHFPEFVNAVIAIYFTYSRMTGASSQPAHDELSTLLTISTFVGFAVTWGALFRSIAEYEGVTLTKLRKHWVREIDYIYLILSFVGLMRVLLGAVEKNPTPQETQLTNIAILVVAIGVSLRFVKTTVEINQWDKEPARRVV
jgi:uncharacterized membrane protein